jgi:GntR family transcriptional regulator, transcriptional repressor for pyruvate dehydrogenase complex
MCYTVRMRKADQVTEDLMTRIVSGELRVGSLLPKESELAEAYGVNRSVIREAIKLLEVHRLVEPVRRRGTEVLDPVASLSAEVLRTMVVPVRGRVDLEWLAELLEIRALLDVEMSRLAAERRTEEDLAALARALEGLRGELGKPSAYAQAMWAMTFAVARAAKNRIFLMMAHWMQRISDDLGEILLDVRLSTGPHLQGMEHLVALIRRGDSEAIPPLVRAFHAWATPRLLEAARRR